MDGSYIFNESSGPVSVTFVDTGDSVENAKRLLAGIPGGFDKALKSAARRTGTHVQAQAAKFAGERYDISAANIKAELNAQVHASGGTLRIRFSGKRVPLYEFGGISPAVPEWDTSKTVPALLSEGWRMVHPGVTARAHVLKDTSPERIDGAFVAVLSGHTGIYMRTSRTEQGVKQLYGPAVPQMIGNETVTGKLSEDAKDFFERTLSSNAEAILAGYWHD